MASMMRGVWSAIALAGGLASATDALAAPQYSGSIAGLFSDAVLTGTNLFGSTGLPRPPQDNTATAYCNLTCPNLLDGDPATTLTWGTLAPPAGAPISSTVVFTGASFTGVAPGATFLLGTLTYTNGSSAPDSNIFGATLTLSAAVAGIAVEPIAIGLRITSTSNDGTPRQNADFLLFPPSTFGTTDAISFNVLEGVTATAELYGRIVGDPMLEASSIRIQQGSGGNGFIGNGPVLVPEPGTLALLGSGMLGLGLSRRRHRHSWAGGLGLSQARPSAPR